MSHTQALSRFKCLPVAHEHWFCTLCDCPRRLTLASETRGRALPHRNARAPGRAPRAFGMPTGLPTLNSVHRTPLGRAVRCESGGG